MKLYRKLHFIIAEITAGQIHLNEVNSRTGGITVLVIVGSDVLERRLHVGDPLLARIHTSPDILYSEKYIDGSYVNVSFIKKESADKIMSMLKDLGYVIIGIIVMKSPEGNELHAEVSKITAKNMKLKVLVHDPFLANAICGVVYRRLRIPLLLFFLGVLLVNWFAFSSLAGKVQIAKANAEQATVQSKHIETVNLQQREMLEKLMSVPIFSSAELLDAIGEKVPDGVMLTEMDIITAGDGKNILGKTMQLLKIKGTASSENLMKFIAVLKSSPRFSGLSLVSYGSSKRAENANMFEISIPL